jgi:hypothetical protein
MLIVLGFTVLASLIASIVLWSKHRGRAAIITGTIGIVAFFVMISQPSYQSDLSSTSASKPADNPSDASTTSEATDAPTATPDRHDERQPYQDYWNRVVGALALAQLSIHYAANALADGDSVKASQLLSAGEKQASIAKDTTTSDVPDQWQNGTVGPSLYSAANDTDDALQKARAWLDDGKPSEIADAQDTAERAKDEIDSATHDARVSYQEMGGRAGDLESMEDSIISLRSSFDTILQSPK